MARSSSLSREIRIWARTIGAFVVLPLVAFLTADSSGAAQVAYLAVVLTFYLGVWEVLRWIWRRRPPECEDRETHVSNTKREVRLWWKTTLVIVALVLFAYLTGGGDAAVQVASIALLICFYLGIWEVLRWMWRRHPPDEETQRSGP